MTDLADDLRALVEELEREAAEVSYRPRLSLAHSHWAARLRALLAKHEGACRCEFKTCDQQTVHRRDCPRYDGPVHTQ